MIPDTIEIAIIFIILYAINAINAASHALARPVWPIAYGLWPMP